MEMHPILSLHLTWTVHCGNARVGNSHILVLLFGGLGDSLKESRNANSTSCTRESTSGVGIMSVARGVLHSTSKTPLK